MKIGKIHRCKKRMKKEIVRDKRLEKRNAWLNREAKREKEKKGEDNSGQGRRREEERRKGN